MRVPQNALGGLRTGGEWALKDASQATALCVDKGLFSDLAVRLAQTFKRVLYHVPNTDAFPLPNASYVGEGLEGLEVVEDIYCEAFPYVDCFVFFDTGFGGLQAHLRDMGKKVWGSNMSECLENDRVLCKELFEEEGLPVGPYKAVKGITTLKVYLKENKDIWVKIPKWRGVSETFFAKTYKSVEPKINDIQNKLGPLAEKIEFVCEKELNEEGMEEVGYDGYSVEGMLPEESLVGIEIKDAGFAGRIMKFKELAEPIQRVTSAMAEMMQSYDHQGAFSNEIRMGKKHIPYMIDACQRCPNPPSALYSMMYSNFPEIVWAGANGEVLDPEYEFTHGVQLQGKSDWADGERWLPIDFDPKLRPNVRITNGYYDAGQYWHVPLRFGIKEVCNILGWGNSYPEAIAMATKVAEGVSGCDLKLNTDALDKAVESIDAIAKIGVDLK